jgi:Cdc6-like AAA superfamily ATPase
MPKTNLKTKPKAIIQKKKIYFTRKNKKSNSISKGKILASKSKDKEVQIELINYSLKKSRNKSLINNKRFRTKEKSNDKSAKNKVKDVKIRNNNLNNSNKINNIKKNKENEKLNSKFLNKKRRKEKLDYDEIKQIENDEYYEEEQEKDEESIKSFSEARLEYLPCRKEEQDLIYNYIKQGLQTNGNYHSLYIAGMPGTGKTASVKTILNILESELNEAMNKRNGKALGKDGIIPFKTIFLSGINFPNISNVFKIIYKFIFAKVKDKLNIKDYIQLLNEFFSNRKKYNSSSSLNDPSNSHIILIIDEIDILINNSQNLLYNIFNWTTYDYAKLIVISISNTLDLPNRLLPKIRSRMGDNIIMFKPYNKEELGIIIKDRGIDLSLFSQDAIRLSCVKVAAINGDLRRVFHILTRAKEINSAENYKKKNKELVSKFDILNAWNELFSSKISNVIKSLHILEKIIIATVLSLIKDQNNNKIRLGDLYERKDIFMKKYNENSELYLEMTWEEYKKIIYNLLRIKLLNYGDIQKSNFIENNIVIRFYVDEFTMACESDIEFKPVMDYLTQIVNT